MGASSVCNGTESMVGSASCSVKQVIGSFYSGLDRMQVTNGKLASVELSLKAPVLPKLLLGYVIGLKLEIVTS